MLLNRKEIIILPNNGNIFVMGTSGRLRQHGAWTGFVQKSLQSLIASGEGQLQWYK